MLELFALFATVVSCRLLPLADVASASICGASDCCITKQVSLLVFFVSLYLEMSSFVVWLKQLSLLIRTVQSSHGQCGFLQITLSSRRCVCVCTMHLALYLWFKIFCLTPSPTHPGISRADLMSRNLPCFFVDSGNDKSTFL